MLRSTLDSEGIGSRLAQIASERARQTSGSARQKPLCASPAAPMRPGLYIGWCLCCNNGNQFNSTNPQQLRQRHIHNESEFGDSTDVSHLPVAESIAAIRDHTTVHISHNRQLSKCAVCWILDAVVNAEGPIQNLHASDYCNSTLYVAQVHRASPAQGAIQAIRRLPLGGIRRGVAGTWNRAVNPTTVTHAQANTVHHRSNGILRHDAGVPDNMRPHPTTRTAAVQASTIVLAQITISCRLHEIIVQTLIATTAVEHKALARLWQWRCGARPAALKQGSDSHTHDGK